MTQKEFFKKCNTDHLLSMRYSKSCQYPKNVGDLPDYKDGCYTIDKELLYQELSERPHRIRAKHRRKKNSKK